MKLCSLLKEALDGGAQTTGYLGRAAGDAVGL